MEIGNGLQKQQSSFLLELLERGQDEVIVRSPMADQKLMELTGRMLRMLEKLAQSESASTQLNSLKASYEKAASDAVIMRIDDVLPK